MEFKETATTNTKIEYNTIDKIFETLRYQIINNSVMIFSDSSIFVQHLDAHIFPYYKSLLKTILDHIKKLLLNYIKYIINQYEGIKILKMLLDRLLL